MIKEKIEVKLKNVKTFQGHDGQGFNADLWINGLKCMSIHDGAYDGQFEYSNNTYQNPKAEQVKANIKFFDEHIETLPETKHNLGGKEMFLKEDRDSVIEELLITMQEAKELKKLNKLMLTSLLFGIPNGDSYMKISYKKPLADFPKEFLQMQVDKWSKTECTNGKVLLNTNLKEIGITF